MKKIDLHTHSTASDGTKTPTQLVKFAKENGISAMALTDHDTVAGIAEFFEAGRKFGVETIAGVEISAKYKTEMHILGLFIDIEDETLNKRLNILKNSRKERNEKILQLAIENGFDITQADVTEQKDGGKLENTGRAHMARAMVRKGYAKDVQEAFTKYLKKGNPCYAERITFSPKESIQLIKEANGLAILAHPIYITKDEDELEKLLIELKGYGLDGVESLYSEYPIEYRDMCLKLCKKLDLLASGGSDFHAMNKPKTKIGKVCGDMDIPYDLLEDMKRKKVDETH